MRFTVNNVNLDDTEGMTPKQLIEHAIVQIRAEGEELAWDVQGDDGDYIASDLTPALMSEAQRSFDALPKARKAQLAAEVFETLEYDSENRPGSEWSSDTTQALGELFERYGVKFTEPTTYTRQ